MAVHEARGNAAEHGYSPLPLNERSRREGRKMAEDKCKAKVPRGSVAQVSLEKELDAVRPVVDGTSTFCGPRAAPVRCIPTTFFISLTWIIPFRVSSDFS